MTGDETVPWNDSAVLVWMSPGDSPSAAAFDPNNRQEPPAPNPEGWWYLGQAIVHATELIAAGANNGKEPWIKVGDAVFDPPHIRVLYKTIQTLKGRV